MSRLETLLVPFERTNSPFIHEQGSTGPSYQMSKSKSSDFDVEKSPREEPFSRIEPEPVDYISFPFHRPAVIKLTILCRMHVTSNDLIINYWVQVDSPSRNVLFDGQVYYGICHFWHRWVGPFCLNFTRHKLPNHFYIFSFASKWQIRLKDLKAPAETKHSNQMMNNSF